MDHFYLDSKHKIVLKLARNVPRFDKGESPLGKGLCLKQINQIMDTENYYLWIWARRSAGQTTSSPGYKPSAQARLLLNLLNFSKLSLHWMWHRFWGVDQLPSKLWSRK